MISIVSAVLPVCETTIGSPSPFRLANSRITSRHYDRIWIRILLELEIMTVNFGIPREGVAKHLIGQPHQSTKITLLSWLVFLWRPPRILR